MFISKNSKKKIIDILELLCKKTGISNHSLGVMIRSYHFGFPCVLMLTLLLCNQLLAYMFGIFLLLIVFLHILFDGCILSMLENRLCNDKFNIVDPFLEFNNADINHNTRKIATKYLATCYIIVFYGIYYIRFYYLEA